MALLNVPGMRPVLLGDLSVEVERRDDGSVILRSPHKLGDFPRSVTDRLDEWAGKAPDRIFLADRRDGEWRTVTYAQALARVRSIGEYMLDHGLSADRPMVILSGNSVEHALMALGAMYAGIPYAPVSTAYSLVSQDHAKLKHVCNLLTPGMVFTADGKPYEKALAAVMKPGMSLVVAREPVEGYDTHLFDELLATPAGDAVEAAHAAITPDTVAKFLFTSGSTGMPKAVINTHGMMACNQEMIVNAMAFMREEPPVLVDWLPWNHTAGGNHNFGLVLYNGGSLYIDEGSPTPRGIAATVRNLTDIAPTLYFNVPKGYEMLTAQFAGNDALRRNFYSRLKLMQYAGAGLSQHVWDALESNAEQTVGEKVVIVTGYGSTETAPFALTTTWAVERPGEVGLPAPGLELKLVPNAEKTEVRLRGPSITPGYWRQPEKTKEAFDEEGFYLMGDALKFVDPSDPDKGLIFDGRVTEDFKLSTGTWVDFAGVRAKIVKTFAPYVRDAVLTGLNRNFIGALLFTDHDAVRRIAPELADADDAAVAANPEVRRLFQQRLDDLGASSTGSSNFVARAIIVDSPPSLDDHEVTDKGSINQRAVMAARAHLIEDIYADEPAGHVLVTNRAK
ncbi:feruloyl-CoA synthase [Zhengella mangrovi]|uniref:Feruloyl-CoA synthase n=1 Tax=Zhengella mangrovi TaxID=1982044 RepID=A0A2G1QUI0_9HYPH|nr:feruloyl-CoA synthase [Zhengella mangrovi]PHP69120.1 feruloyl-CoA synthase [Zhengella mangrovi]